MNNVKFQRSIISNIQNREDLQRYLLASSKIGQSIQDEIDMVVADGKLNDACLRHLLDPIYKNVMQKQNLFEIVFKDISKFDPRSPIIGSLLSEIESGKLTDESVKKFLNMAPDPKDIELNQKLQKLKSFNTNRLKARTMIVVYHCLQNYCYHQRRLPLSLWLLSISLYYLMYLKLLLKYLKICLKLK